MKKLKLIFILITISLTTYSQNISRIEAIKKLSFLVGDWKGSGWQRTNMGKDSVSIIQHNIMVNDTVFQINGSRTFLSNTYVLNSTINISYDGIPNRYQTSMNSTNGPNVEGEASLPDDHTLVYTFSIDTKTKMRYTFAISGGNYTIFGELSTDAGNSWIPNSRLNLTR